MSANTKFCVLPGQEPVRVAKLDGRVVMIGETPREIPEDMHGDAIAKGARTEADLKALKKSLTADAMADNEKALAEKEAAEKAAAEKLAAEKAEADAMSGTREEQIIKATMAVIAKADPDECIGNGAPKVPVLEAILGFDITADERNDAFAEVSKPQE